MNRTAPAFVGQSVQKIEDVRLLKGKGRFVDDVTVEGLLHAAFVRSPLAHARIAFIDRSAALELKGVVAVLTAHEVAQVATSWKGLFKLPGMIAGEQTALATGVVRHVGEPVALVIAESRALAEDGCALVDVDYEELPVVVDPVSALQTDSPLVHPEIGSNLALKLDVGSGSVDEVMATADHTVTVTMRNGRVTATAMEPRGVLAEANAGDGSLTIRISTQASHMLQATYARIFRLPESRIRVLAEDVGGAFGMKAHVYPDEVAVCAASIILMRPIKWIQDRWEAFQSDSVARDERVTATLGLDKSGAIVALRSEVLSDGGAYSVYPRTMVSEGMQVCTIMPGPYVVPAYHGTVRVAITNKTPLSVYRAVGHPMAILVMESLMDAAAHEVGLTAHEIRRRNLVPKGDFPFTSITGNVYDSGSYKECLDRLVAGLDLPSLEVRKQVARTRGRVLGVGIVNFVELSSPGSQFYGSLGAPITAHDQIAIRMEPDGTVVLMMGTAGQGQGLSTTASQVVADRLGLRPEDVEIFSGDTARTPHGSGLYGSRSAVVTIGAANDAANQLSERLRSLAAHLLEASPDDIELVEGSARVRGAGSDGIPLAEVADAAHYRSHLFPQGSTIELSLVGVGHSPKAVYNNGAHAAIVEIDPELGTLKVIHYSVVEDCGVVVNPKIVEEQIRGGVAQGLGQALFEELCYDDQGQILTTTMLDYHIPSADTMPDIVIEHMETPSPLTALGSKGVGEAGTAGAPAAIHCAVNDALAQMGPGRVWNQPIRPEDIMVALGQES